MGDIYFDLVTGVRVQTTHVEARPHGGHVGEECVVLKVDLMEGERRGRVEAAEWKNVAQMKPEYEGTGS